MRRIRTFWNLRSWSAFAGVAALSTFSCTQPDVMKSNNADDDDTPTATTPSATGMTSTAPNPSATSSKMGSSTASGTKMMTTTTTTTTTTSSASSTGGNTATGTGTGTGTMPKPKGDLKTEGFEKGLGSWTIEGGIWAVGGPTDINGPKPQGKTGKGVAGTKLDGDYPGSEKRKKATLFSPEFTIPTGASPRVRYWHWYEFGRSDFGEVKLRIAGVKDSEDMKKDAWTRKESLVGSGDNQWMQSMVYLPTEHAGKRAQLAFELHVRSEDSAPGWFLDNVSVENTAMKVPTTGFEQGWEDWSVVGGTWAIGKATDPRGPRRAFSGEHVAGTVLSGNYPGTRNDDERHALLISPRIKVPADGLSPRVRSRHWYRFGRNDRGEISIREGNGKWKVIEDMDLSGSSDGEWDEMLIDLKPYKGKDVQIGFRLISKDRNTGPGWYIDEVAFELK